MNKIRRGIPGASIVVLGVVLGWVAASLPSPRAILKANAGDRWGESIMTTGPILERFVEGYKIQLAQDAIYFLDYKSGRLMATVPSFQQSTSNARLVDSFAVRDLVSDFKIDLDKGATPHFLMTTASVGIYNEGCSPLFVFESSTQQVGVYKVQQLTVGTVAQPKFELLQMKSFAEATQGPDAQ
ncbi:hypothetical protein ACYOEI_01360 [Singulisphaera rosea]